MKVLYFHDCCDDEQLQSELTNIKIFLTENNIFDYELIEKDLPHDMYDLKFDILFFDWGGMSMGNSMLEHFCSDIYKMATENPSKYFIMASSFSEWAMKDVLSWEGNNIKPANLILNWQTEKLII